MARGSPAARVVKSVASHTALIGLSIIFIIPFAWLISTSLKSESHMSSLEPEWIPRAEYVQVGPDAWAEVVRNEVLEYHGMEYDEKGWLLPRRPRTSKVDLVDRWGDPLAEEMFRIPAGDLPVRLNSGRIPDPLHEGFARDGIELPEATSLSRDPVRDLWRLTTEDAAYIVDRERDQLVVSRNVSERIIDSSEIVTRPRPTFRHYAKGIRAFKFPLFLQNTLLICTVGVLGTVFSCSWVAFGFSVLQWPGRNKIFYLMLATLMLPPQVTMIPVFIIFKNLGWINSYKPLLVPAFFGNAFFIFLLRQFFLTIPKDLIDAARVDGCSTLRIYWQVVLPLSIPALATVALFTFMGSWNDFMGPLIYVVDEAKYTLSLGLAMFKGRFASRYGEMMAVSVLLTLPIIVLFFFTQKTFIQGIKTSGMKG